MILYRRTQWYGVGYLFHCYGTLLPRTLPIVVLAASLSLVVFIVEEEGAEVCESWLFTHPFAYQLFGLIFGYLSVMRLNMSYGRFYEGLSQLKVMVGALPPGPSRRLGAFLSC